MRKFLFLFLILSMNFLNLSAYELSIATIFQNEAPYLKEWIEYHRMVGVEHFWLYNDSSDDDWEEVLEPYISKGIVEVFYWPSIQHIRYIENQRNAMRDALKRSCGVTKWLALIDVDEFILPLKNGTVPECLDKYFSEASAIYINWHHFGTGGINLKKGESVLFGLTASSNKYHPRNSVGKSIVRPDLVKADCLWNIHHYVLEPFARYYNGDNEPLDFIESDLKLDGKVHSEIIRINHYTMRDEWFFHNVRLARARRLGIEEWLVWEHYYAFNQEQDTTIVNFITQSHLDQWNEIWK